MTDTAELAELIAQLRDYSIQRHREDRGMLVMEAAIALAAQAQELTQERARNHAFMAAAEAADARVRALEILAEVRLDNLQRLQADRDAIEAKTFTETREQCAHVADRIDSVNGIAAMIRALRHIRA